MSQFDEVKCQEMSQSIAAIFDHADASLAEQLCAISLVLRFSLDNEHDKMLRAYLLMNLIKHLTMDSKADALKVPKLDLLRPD